MTPSPPSDKPPIQPGSPKPTSGQPGSPTGKKFPQGWQLPLDGRLQEKARLHPAQRKRLEAKPPSNFRWYFLMLGTVLLIAFLAGFIHWREPIRKTIRSWYASPNQEGKTPPGTPVGTPPVIVSTVFPPQPHPEAPISSRPTTLPASPPQIIKASDPAIVLLRPPPASVSNILVPPPTRPPPPTAPVLPAEAGEAEARRQTLAESNLVYGGKPRPLVSTMVSEVLYNQGYVVGYSETRRDPVWVGYRLDKTPAGGALPRPKKFSPDDRTSAHINTKEYSNTGYDRGHLAPNSAIARRFGPEAQLETFLMSNITPQRPDLNRKAWERLERLEDKYANEFDHLYVITGPIFDEYKETLSPVSDVEIPDEFYKILVDDENGSIKMLAFRIPQTVEGREPLDNFLTSVDNIQKATGLDFFWSLSDPLENRLESEKPSEVWKIH